MNFLFTQLKTTAISLFLVFLISLSALAAPADFDTTFSSDGKVTTTMGIGASEIFKIVVQPDGKMIGAGYAQNSGSAVRQFALARYNADGSLDAGFGNGGKVFTTIGGGNAYIFDVALLANGKIIAAGLLDTGSRYQTAVARYNANGSLDTTFSGDGIFVYNYDATSSDYALSLVIQADGKILIGSYLIVLINNSPIYAFYISRLNSGGTFDTTFNSTGKTIGEFGSLTTGFVKIGLQPNGKIIAAGPGGNGSNTDFAVIRYNSNGSFDPTFGNAGRVYTNFNHHDIPRDLAVLPDGKFVVTGSTGSSTELLFLTVKYNANGGQDSSFGFAGFASYNFSELNDVAESVTFQPDGKILVAGRTGANLTNNNFAVVRYRTNGLADPTFGSNGVKTFALGNGDDIAYSVAVQKNGRIVLAGSADAPNTPGFAVTRLLGRATQGDFDNEGRADVGVFRPTDGTWYISRSSNGLTEYPFGNSNDIPVNADFDGDGATDVAIFRPSNGRWYILRSRDGYMTVPFGMAGDVPVAADYDGDGKAEIAVFRPSNGAWFYLRSSSNYNAFVAATFGMNGDKPVTGDFDGDGKADYTVFRPADGGWYILGSQRGFFAARFGLGDDVPLSADFDGDMINDIAVFRPSGGGWYILRSSDGAFEAAQFGMFGDIPQPADYDLDGRADIAVFRPTEGAWFILQSTDGFDALQFGTPGDVPVIAAR